MPNLYGITRRDFLKKAAGGTIIAAASISLPNIIQASPEVKKSRVVLIRDENVLDGNKLNAPLLGMMLDSALAAYFDESAPLAAWKWMLKPEDVLGIKTNAWKYLPTPKELESYIEKRVVDAGVLHENISINDRGVQFDGIFQKSTALINVRPMRSHHWCGISGCIKNYIMFANNPPDYHDDACADLATLFELPVVKGKSRMHILVMTTPLYHGKGPHHYQPQYTWQYKGLLVSEDPVAVDSVGLRIIEAKRLEAFKKIEPFAVSPKHIRLADERHHLGNSKPENIELIKMGWDKDILI